MINHDKSMRHTLRNGAKIKSCVGPLAFDVVKFTYVITLNYGITFPTILHTLKGWVIT